MILNPLSDHQLECIPDGQIAINSQGLIVALGTSSEMASYQNHPEYTLIQSEGKVIIPGFIDLHFHWVQDDVRKMKKENLLDWLSNYTWPYEQKFADPAYALERAQHFSSELVAAGTLGGAAYGSLHPHTTAMALDLFQGHFIAGNVLMTQNSPDYLIQTQSNALECVEKLSKQYKERYAMTPRFAITTHPEVMAKGAALARENQNFIQTHLSETKGEIDFVLSLYREGHPGFEDVRSYTEIYDRCHLLGPQTIMGHGIYLDEAELKRLSETQTILAHCPTSNAPVEDLGLGSGLFDYEKVESYNIPWALGSDIGAGPYLSMLDVMASFVSQHQGIGRASATWQKALYRATLAGAKALGLESRCGHLATGKEANFVVFDCSVTKAEDFFAEIEHLFKTKRAALDQLPEAVYFKGKNQIKR